MTPPAPIGPLQARDLARHDVTFAAGPMPAGIDGFRGMARLLAAMPWNGRAATAPSLSPNAA